MRLFDQLLRGWNMWGDEADIRCVPICFEREMQCVATPFGKIIELTGSIKRGHTCVLRVGLFDVRDRVDIDPRSYGCNFSAIWTAHCCAPRCFGAVLHIELSVWVKNCTTFLGIACAQHGKTVGDGSARQAWFWRFFGFEQSTPCVRFGRRVSRFDLRTNPLKDGGFFAWRAFKIGQQRHAARYDVLAQIAAKITMCRKKNTKTAPYRVSCDGAGQWPAALYHDIKIGCACTTHNYPVFADSNQSQSSLSPKTVRFG